VNRGRRSAPGPPKRPQRPGCEVDLASPVAHAPDEIPVRRGHGPLPVGQDAHVAAQQAWAAGGGADYRLGVEEGLDETLLYGRTIDCRRGGNDDQAN